MREVDADCGVPVEFDGKDRCLAQDMQIRPLSVIGEVASGCIASFALVRACSSDTAERVEDANVVTRPAELKSVQASSQLAIEITYGSIGFLSIPVTSSKAFWKSSSIGRKKSLNEVCTGPEVPWFLSTYGIADL